MRGTRKTIQLLDHRAVSGLFLTKQGEYVADLNPDEGGRIVRKFGASRGRALRLFEELKRELEEGARDRSDPLLLAFLSDMFLASQQHLKGYAYVNERVGAISRFLEARFPTLRVSEVRRHHADALREFYADRSPRTWQANLQKLKQALGLAVDLELLDANPLARYKGVRFDNRRLRTCTIVSDHFLSSRLLWQARIRSNHTPGPRCDQSQTRLRLTPYAVTAEAPVATCGLGRARLCFWCRDVARPMSGQPLVVSELRRDVLLPTRSRLRRNGQLDAAVVAGHPQGLSHHRPSGQHDELLGEDSLGTLAASGRPVGPFGDLFSREPKPGAVV